MSWEKAPWTNAFKDIEGTSKPTPSFDTRVKMLWDNENLYLFAKLEEPHINGYLRQKDTIIYHDNDFEVFLNPISNLRNILKLKSMH
ncbi:carbohydrate-binding family 9-like protein [Sphingobacterium sp. E70]|nr:carbohydrate-binding family 9-like protein [Sphingobacterium sp. E70]